MNPFVDDPEKGALLPGAAAPAAPAKKWSRAAPLVVLGASLFVLAGVSAASRPAPAVAAPELVDINLPRVPVIDNVLEGIGIDVPDKIDIDIPTNLNGLKKLIGDLEDFATIDLDSLISDVESLIPSLKQLKALIPEQIDELIDDVEDLKLKKFLEDLLSLNLDTLVDDLRAELPTLKELQDLLNAGIDDFPKLINEALGLIKQLPIVPSVINDIEAGIEFIKDAVGEIPDTLDQLIKMIQNAVGGGMGDLENLIDQILSALDGVDLPPNVQKLVDEIVMFLNNNKQPIGGQKDEHGCLVAAGYSYCPAFNNCTRSWTTPCPSLVVGPAATLPAPAPPTPEIEVGNATTLPAPVPEPEETTPLQDYATYEATKDISDPNTAAVAGAAAAQVAGALQ
jgi:hypothetical protein